MRNLEGLAATLEIALSEGGTPPARFQPLWETFLHETEKALSHPHHFAPYHQKIRTPFDYYQFGIEFIRPLVDHGNSKVAFPKRWDALSEAVARGENAILLANHQTEVDPQAIALLLENRHPKLAEQIIYVAGERVITDPVAIPFSLGCDLLCIYSRRYLDAAPQERERKLLHNREVMSRMSRLLAEGGKVIYVAPSGGRDRPNAEGHIEVAPLDPDSIEMFHLMARKSGRTTHFYPMALRTHRMLPPPEQIQHSLGERRAAHFTPIGIALASPFDMTQIYAAEKGENRTMRSSALWRAVHTHYEMLC